MSNPNSRIKTNVSSSTARTAKQIADSVRKGELKAIDITNEYIANIEARETEIHAFNTLMFDQARASATAIDAAVARGDDPGPLAGVPVALKDNLCTAGIPTTCSSKILEGWKPPYDATVVTRIAQAGGIAIGKTNLDEFAMGSSTENSAFGPTRNPLDPQRVPGGSSGGSVAAVAGDFAPLALGSDTGGSIRQPASYCGVVGVKPTYGYVSRYGLIAFASSLDQIGTFGKTVEDSALLLDVISGADAFDSTCIQSDRPDILSELDSDIAGLRIGIINEMMGDGIAPLVRERTQQATAALELVGAKVGEVNVPAAVYGIGAYYLVAPAEASSNLARFDGVRYGLRVEGKDMLDMYCKTRAAGFGEEVKRRIMLGTYALSAGYYDAYYGKAQRVRTLIIRDFAAAFENFDVLVSPTAPTTAFKFGENDNNPLAMYANDLCTIPVSLAGLPALSVPFGNAENDMPTGVQVIAPALGEPVMFRVARAIERAALSTAKTSEQVTNSSAGNGEA